MTFRELVIIANAALEDDCVVAALDRKGNDSLANFIVSEFKDGFSAKKSSKFQLEVALMNMVESRNELDKVVNALVEAIKIRNERNAEDYERMKKAEKPI